MIPTCCPAWHARLLLPLLTLLALPGAAGAQPLEIPWWTIAGGGGQCTGGSGPGELALNGTIGQPAAGPLLTGGDFTLSGGFWFAPPPACPCDWNDDTALNSQDFFDFLACFFAGC